MADPYDLGVRNKNLDPVATVLRHDLTQLAVRTLALEQRVRVLETTAPMRRRTRDALIGYRTKAIRSLYATGKVSLRDLAEAFGLTHQRVHQIIKGADADEVR